MISLDQELQLEEHRAELTAHCCRMLASTHEAEDAVQETFLRAWRGFDSFEGRAALRTWLYRIATNVCLDMLRSGQRRPILLEAPPDEPSPERTDDPADLVEARESVRLALVAARRSLPLRQQEVLLLREVMQWTAAETAQRLQTSVPSVNERAPTGSNDPRKEPQLRRARLDRGSSGMSTILGIWAHPDDEVFVSGGLMADAVRRGDRVVCLHMTRGEGGLNLQRPCSPETLGRIRERELQASLAHLGVTEQRFFGYPDGGLAGVRKVEAVARIHDALAEIQPDEILTFGPDGFTGHPDHVILSEWVTTAMRLWNKPRARLYHAAVSRHWTDSFAPRLNEFDFFWSGHPIACDRHDIAIQLDDELLSAKVDALREHASQMTPLFDSYGDEFMRAMGATEHFVLGPRPAFRARVLQDLRCG